jgi:hypothetical protein
MLRIPRRSRPAAACLCFAACLACGSDDDPGTNSKPTDAGVDTADAPVDAPADASDPDVASDSTTPDAPSDAVGDVDNEASPDAPLEAAHDGPDSPGDPAVFQTPDALVVCNPTPEQACTPSDMAWVASEYGTTVLRADSAAINASGKGFRLIALVEREGPSNLDVFVVDEAGAPLSGIPVAFYFSSAPDTSRPDEWYPVKVTGMTEASGRVGFALTSSAYLDTCGGGGPHAIWISQPDSEPETTVPSDLVDELGMLGGTNHRHLDLLFQRIDPSATPVDAVRCPL